jgi:hypothetical protein
MTNTPSWRKLPVHEEDYRAENQEQSRLASSAWLDQPPSTESAQ